MRRKVTRSFRDYALGAYLLIILAGFVGFEVLSSQNHKLSKQNKELIHLGLENKARISDIQVSRIQSCKEIYRSFHVVFDPFFPPKTKRTAKQKHDLAKFDKIISSKIKACKSQVTPPPIKAANG